jgi:hypothetical protein
MTTRQIASQDMFPFNAGWPASSYRASENASLFGSSAVSTSALATFLPFLVPVRTTIARIGFYLVTAQVGAECRLGLYADSNGAPGALILDAGTVDLSTGAGAIREIVTSLDQAPGLIWSCCQMKNVATAATVIRMGASITPRIPVTAAILLAANGMSRYYQQSIIYGSALPATAGAVTPQASTDAPAIVLRSA